MTIDRNATPSQSEEPAGEIAGRLAALAHLFAVPVFNEDRLRDAGLDVSTIAALDLEEDELAAEHYRVLSHDLVPDAGVFLEEDGMLGGPLSRALHERMTAAGFTPDDATRSSGHIVNELGFLAHQFRLGRQEEAAAFWQEHACGWMPLIRLHLEQAGSSWFDAMAVAFAQVLDDLKVVLEAIALPQTPTLPPGLPVAGLDLDEPRVGLARIGEYLAVPARSGLVLSRSRLSHIGRSFRLPTGFGSRSRIVEGLLRSGAQYDGWDAVCDALLHECDQAEACWKTEAGSIWQGRWRGRLDHTRSILDRMRDAEADTHTP